MCTLAQVQVHQGGKKQYPQAMGFAKSLKHTFLRSPLVPGFCPLYGFVSTRCTLMPDMSGAAHVLLCATFYRRSEITEMDAYALSEEFSEILEPISVQADILSTQQAAHDLMHSQLNASACLSNSLT